MPEITYGELQNGDHILIQGFWFEVADLYSYPWVGPAMDSGAYGKTVIRFTGKPLDPKMQERGFNGIYGARNLVTCHIRERQEQVAS